MHRLLAILALLAAAMLSAADAAASETRMALVIGNASYKPSGLTTSVNDAALIAQALQTAGFKITAGRDLTGDGLRHAFAGFADSLKKAGPDTVVVVYFAGYAVQLEGENYLLPIDAEVVKPADLAMQAVRLSDQVRALATLHLKASFVIVDAARANPAFASAWEPASGLAWSEPEANMLVAFNAAPGTVSRDLGDSYGLYAKALAEMIREDSLSPASLFDRVRLRVSDTSKGAQVPWHASKIQNQFVFLERDPGAPPRAESAGQLAKMRSQSMRGLDARDAYFIALLRDTFDGYTEFLSNYWNDPLSKRVRALLAARREAIAWRRTCQSNVPGAYWTYLERYPRGPHAADARSILTRLGASVTVPSRFSRMEFDVPPPLPDELEYLEKTVLVLDDPEFALAPAPPLPANFLAPPPPELWNLPKPAASSGERELPVVKIAPLPADVAVPPGSAIESKSVALENLQQRVPIRGAIELPLGSENSVSAATAQPVETNNPKERADTSTTATAPLLPAPQPQLELSKGSLPDRATAAMPGAEPPPLSTEDRPPAYTPLIAAPLATGQPRRTQGGQGKTGAIPLPVPRPATSRKMGPSLSAPQTTGSIPVSNSSSVNPTSQPISGQSKPTPRAALAAKPRSVHLATDPQAPLPSGPSPAQLSKRALPPRVVDTGSVKLPASPYKPPKPCVVVDGKLICG